MKRRSSKEEVKDSESLQNTEKKSVSKGKKTSKGSKNSGKEKQSGGVFENLEKEVSGALEDSEKKTADILEEFEKKSSNMLKNSKAEVSDILDGFTNFVKKERTSREKKDSNTLKKEVLKTSPLAKFLPNAVTITAMCFGLSSIRFAQCNEWEYAVLCILVSALLDMFDGKIARFLDQSSAFGLELDSLSDLVCFGVAPSVILYLASMQQIGKIGWGICMFYTVCCALRLARFNVANTLNGEITDLDRKYFTGIPAPAGAIVALFPLILFFETENFMIVSPFYIAFFLMFSGCLMVSTIHTFSSKRIEINNTNSWVALTIITFMIICLTSRLWLSLSVLIAFYIVMIPYGVYEYSKALESTKTKE